MRTVLIGAALFFAASALGMVLHTLAPLSPGAVAQEAATEERSEEYREGFRDGQEFGTCEVYRDLDPLFTLLEPVVAWWSPDFDMGDLQPVRDACASPM